MKDSQFVYKVDTASFKDVENHLKACNDNFTPPLDEKVDITEYSKKIAEKAITFESWHAERLIGLVACYFNEPEKKGFITNVSVLHEYGGKGIASILMKNSLMYAKENDFETVELEVNETSQNAISLYKKFDFCEIGCRSENIIMRLIVK